MNSTNTSDRVALRCPKCAGSGKVEWKHIANGDCFMCDGTGNFGDMDAAEVAKIMKGAEKAQWDLDHAPYRVNTEMDGGYPACFWDLTKAAAFTMDCRGYAPNGKVTLTHRDGTPVTRGEVRAAQ